MMFTGVFERFPSLRIYFAETQAGWIPHFIFQADDNYARTRFWAERSFATPMIVSSDGEDVEGAALPVVS